MGGREKAGLLGVAAAGVMAYAVRGRSSSLFAPSVYKGVRGRRAVALTFDDGPSEATPEFLDLLAAYHAKATFFQCGVNVRRLPRVARQISEAGHEIGNHSDTHPYLHFKSPAFIYRELAAAQQSIYDACGTRPRFFRAPFGVRWFGLHRAQRDLGLLGVMWTVIGVDWKVPETRILQHVLRGARNGAILCLHDGRQLVARPDVRATLGALRQLLPILIDRGFHFEKVSEILCPTI
jgi:peptidoglycan/xylan/chitin deacetylase (PgdA/CDA1 family)